MIVHYSYIGVPIAQLSHEKQSIQLPASATIGQLMDKIGETIQDSEGGMLKKATFLVNKSGAKRNTVLSDGDEVIILHAIGGG